MWGWLNEYPERNFDDAGPRSIEELARDVRAREAAGETVWELLDGGLPVGVVGYIQKTQQIGQFHGICFSKDVHGSGIPLLGVAEVLDRAFAAGTEVVEAYYFADNYRVARFLRKLGADGLNEERIPNGSLRKGRPVDWGKMNIPAERFRLLEPFIPAWIHQSTFGSTI